MGFSGRDRAGGTDNFHSKSVRSESQDRSRGPPAPGPLGRRFRAGVGTAPALTATFFGNREGLRVPFPVSLVDNNAPETLALTRVPSPPRPSLPPEGLPHETSAAGRRPCRPG